MRNESREARAEVIEVLMPWGTPVPDAEDALGAAALWLAGGASLVLWTAIAVMLTAV